MRRTLHTAAANACPDEKDQRFFQSYRHLAPVPETPSIFTLELTTLCNNFCSGCANVELLEARQKGKAGIQQMQDWEKIIETIKPFAKLVRLSGGEPTLHPDFDKVVALLEKKRIPYALLSTGRWTTIPPDRIIRLFSNSRHFVGMLISLHGSNADTHNAFVEGTPKAYEEACSNIEYAVRNGLTVFTNTVLTRFSCDEVEAIVKKSLRLGATYALFNRFLTNYHPLEPSESQLRQALMAIENLRVQGFPCRVGNNVPPCFVTNSSEGAKAGFELCHISPNGDVRPDNLTRLSFGNLLEQDLPTLWRSPGAELYRMSFSMDCLQCKAFSRCRGGAKSITLQFGLEKDRLMNEPLDYFEEGKIDLQKKSLKYLALTSD